MDERDRLFYLSQKTLEGLALSTDEVIESIEHAIRGRSRAQVWNAPKAVIQPPDGRYMTATLSAADDPPFLAVKSAILNPRNHERGLPGGFKQTVCQPGARQPLLLSKTKAVQGFLKPLVAE